MEESNDLVCNAYEIILNELRSMERRTMQRDSSLTVLLAMRELYKTKEYMPVSLDIQTCSLGEKIYEDDEYIYIQLEILKEIVDMYVQKNKEDCGVINKDTIMNWLKQHQLVVGKQTERGSEYSRKLPMQKGNTRRYCYISKKKLEKKIADLPI